MARTRVVSWKKDDLVSEDEFVAWIDVRKLDESWRSAEPERYLAPGSGNRETFQYLRAAVAGESGPILRMPRLGFSDQERPKQRVCFVDGRHRFAFVRDHGGAAMPVAVAREDFLGVLNLFASEAKTCTLRI